VSGQWTHNQTECPPPVTNGSITEAVSHSFDSRQLHKSHRVGLDQHLAGHKREKQTAFGAFSFIWQQQQQQPDDDSRETVGHLQQRPAGTKCRNFEPTTTLLPATRPTNENST
jgi:hypothetical protein